MILTLNYRVLEHYSFFRVFSSKKSSTLNEMTGKQKLLTKIWSMQNLKARGIYRWLWNLKIHFLMFSKITFWPHHHGIAVFCLFSEKSAQNRLIPLVLLEILIWCENPWVTSFWKIIFLLYVIFSGLQPFFYVIHVLALWD